MMLRLLREVDYEWRCNSLLSSLRTVVVSNVISPVTLDFINRVWCWIYCINMYFCNTVDYAPVIAVRTWWALANLRSDNRFCDYWRCVFHKEVLNVNFVFVVTHSVVSPSQTGPGSSPPSPHVCGSMA